MRWVRMKHVSSKYYNLKCTWNRVNLKSSNINFEFTGELVNENRALEVELFWLTNWMKGLRRAKASASLTTGRRLVLLNYAQVGVHRAPKRSIAATLSNPASNPKARPQHSRLRTLSRMGFRHFKTFTTWAFISTSRLNQTFHPHIHLFFKEASKLRHLGGRGDSFQQPKTRSWRLESGRCYGV